MHLILSIPFHIGLIEKKTIKNKIYKTVEGACLKVKEEKYEMSKESFWLEFKRKLIENEAKFII